MLTLLGKLANDDGYRARFEGDPKAALAEAGVSRDQVANYEHGPVAKLADKATFEAARKRLADDAAQQLMCMVIPNLRLDFDQGK